MLKLPITFTDFEGNEVTETHHFHVSHVEIVEMKAGGVEEMMRRIITAEDNAAILKEFQAFILKAYGVRDGNAFIKSEEATKRFSQSLAYNQLFLNMLQDADYAANFFLSALPPDLARDITPQVEEMKSAAQPPLPPPPMSQSSQSV